MIKREFYKERKDGVKLYRTYSDEDFKIRKVGTNEIYDEAIDVEGSTYEYEETDQKIEILDAVEDIIEENVTDNSESKKEE